MIRNKHFLFYIWLCSSKGVSELFWTGKNWSTVRGFGKLYSCDEASAIMDQRFHDKFPRPEIQRLTYFELRDKMRRRQKGKFVTKKQETAPEL